MLVGMVNSSPKYCHKCIGSKACCSRPWHASTIISVFVGISASGTTRTKVEENQVTLLGHSINDLWAGQAYPPEPETVI
jgi:hypothetical protein